MKTIAKDLRAVGQKTILCVYALEEQMLGTRFSEIIQRICEKWSEDTMWLTCEFLSGYNKFVQVSARLLHLRLFNINKRYLYPIVHISTEP
jgi:hypothetical protein